MRKFVQGESTNSSSGSGGVESEDPTQSEGNSGKRSCATVEEMGEVFREVFWKESLRVRKIIQNHLVLSGASRVRDLPPEQFCRHGFVLGKSSEAGFGNEMYKVLTGAALSIMLNHSLIIGQTRKKYPFEDYISYSNISFTLKEVKHLWRHNDCVSKYGRHLVMRTDDFGKPLETSGLCSNWREWKQPIIWFQGTTNAVAAQFFLKNIHSEMRNAASCLFGDSEVLQSRPNVFGELMRVLISPSKDIEEAVNWVIGGKEDPDITLHMRLLMNRSVRAVQAALKCIRKALQVLHFDYELFKGKISTDINESRSSEFRVKDWSPTPRWVAFVDFFLASRAKYVVVSGAHRLVGTTYAQLIAALVAAESLAWWDGLWQSPIPRDINRLASYGVD
ncbi:Rhamnogalacturonate lyase family protein [Quillaja saponaria]|uniref:Rhamnogalacturonate lyase family protein n=1 Tax=Quillaja saponaria TaxID=32244 RepID=A0AAD7VHP4_QUISA|nr:Rhamnogalacturonate lyase family protein [Quillaja saponaria]